MRSGYKQTEVGVIPKDWEVEAVGDAFEIRNQLRLPLSQTVRERMVGSYPYYGPTSVQGWINEYRVEGEHALIGEDGDHFLKWRDQAMTLLVTGKFNVNNHAHIVRGTKNLTAWFFWFFANRDISSYLTRQGAGRYKLTKATLLTLPCAVPPLPEQRAIAEALSDVDALLGGLDRLIAKKRDLKQAAMQQLLTGQTRLPGFRGSWEVKCLHEVCQKIQDGTHFSPKLGGNDYLYVTSKNIRFGKLDMSTAERISSAEHFKIHARCDVKKGDLLLTKDGANTGNAALNSLDEPFSLLSSVAMLRLDSRFHSSGYFMYQMLSDQGQTQIKDAMSGNAITRLTLAKIRALRFSVADLPEQTAIADVLTDMDAELAALDQRREKTLALKHGMMQELLTGRTRLV